jgi:hypothetical protein
MNPEDKLDFPRNSINQNKIGPCIHEDFIFATLSDQKILSVKSFTKSSDNLFQSEGVVLFMGVV